MRSKFKHFSLRQVLIVASLTLAVSLAPSFSWAIDLRLVTSSGNFGTKIYSYNGISTTLINTHVKVMHGAPTANGNNIAYISAANAYNYGASTNFRLIIRNKDTGVSSADSLLSLGSYVGGPDINPSSNYPLNSQNMNVIALDYSSSGGLYLFLRNLVSGQFEIASVSSPQYFLNPVSVSPVMTLGVTGSSYLLMEPIFHRNSNQYFYVINQFDSSLNYYVATLKAANVLTGTITDLASFTQGDLGLSSITIDQGTGVILANTYQSGSANFALMYGYFPSTTFGASSLATVATSSLLVGSPTPFPSPFYPASYQIPMNFQRQTTVPTASGIDYMVSYRPQISATLPELRVEQHSLSVGASGVIDTSTLHDIQLLDVVGLPATQAVSVIAY